MLNKEQLEPGDIIISDSGIKAFVRRIDEKYIKVYINRERCKIPFEELSSWNFANPIIDNRLVDSYTFAVRFKQFLKWISENFIMSGPHILEEYEYMESVAKHLLKYQIQTASKNTEIDYLKRLELL